MTTRAVRLSSDLLAEIKSHCRAALPDEACGLLAMDGVDVVRVYPAENIEPSPTSYRLDPTAHYRALSDAEANGWTLGGVFHSHPNGPAAMSQTDLKRAIDDQWIYLVYSVTTDRLTVWDSSGRELSIL